MSAPPSPPTSLRRGVDASRRRTHAAVARQPLRSTAAAAAAAAAASVDGRPRPMSHESRGHQGALSKRVVSRLAPTNGRCRSPYAHAHVMASQGSCPFMMLQCCLCVACSVTPTFHAPSPPPHQLTMATLARRDSAPSATVRRRRRISWAPGTRNVRTPYHGRLMIVLQCELAGAS